MLSDLIASNGKYGAFIWPAYGVTVLAFAGMILSSLRHARRWRGRAEALGRQEPGRQEPGRQELARK